MLEDEVDKLISEGFSKHKLSQEHVSKQTKSKLNTMTALGVAFLLVSVAAIGTWAGFMIQRGSDTSATNLFNKSEISAAPADWFDSLLSMDEDGELSSSGVFQINEDCGCFTPSSSLRVSDSVVRMGKDLSSVPLCSIDSDSTVLQDEQTVSFSIPAKTPASSTVVDLGFSSSVLLPVEFQDAVASFSVSCSGTLFSQDSYVRLILLDSIETMYLVFSTDSFAMKEGPFSVENIAIETVCVDDVQPVALVVEVSDALAHLSDIHVVLQEHAGELLLVSEEIAESQEEVRVQMWNDVIANTGMLWYAGSTDISRKSFREKLSFFGGQMPNLHGFEYYCGGLFSIGVPEESDDGGSIGVSDEGSLDDLFSITSFDWRNRHDATDPCSPYFKYREENFLGRRDIANYFSMNGGLWSENDHVLHTGDFNGDGRTDVLLQNRIVDFGQTFILIGRQAPDWWTYEYFYEKVDVTESFSMNVVRWSAENQILHTGDFNGDGLTDILLQSRNPSGHTYLLIAEPLSYITPGLFSFYDAVDVTDSFGMTALQWSADHQILHTGHFNDDARTDLLLQNKAIDGSTYLLLGKKKLPSDDYFYDAEDITQTPYMTSEKWSDNLRKLHTGDFNGDGLTDLLLQNRASQWHATYLLFAQLDGTFKPEVAIQDMFGMTQQNWADDERLLHTGDFNGDGLTDLLLQNRLDGGQTYLLIGRDAEPGTNDYFETVTDMTAQSGMSSFLWSAAHHVVHVGDFTCDGRDDVLLQNILAFDDGPFLMYGRASGSLSCKISIEDCFLMDSTLWSAEAHVIHVGDFDSNGRFDLLLQNRGAAQSCDLLLGDSLQSSGWMPKRTTTQVCGDCWAFGPVYALQGLVNLYYNQPLDLDLSEQHVISCQQPFAPPVICNQGGNTETACGHITCTGVLLEEDFPYDSTDPRPDCPTDIDDNETINATDYFTLPYTQGEQLFKQNLITYGPGASKIGNWGHAMCLVGFGTVKAGDIIMQGNLPHTGVEITVEPDSPFIGQNYWIYEQSWGSWGNPQTPYIYVLAATLEDDLTRTFFFNTPISSTQTYTSADIQVRDEDNDGYYTWGIGQKPAGYNDIPDIQDGNDNNPGLGPLNDLYQCYLLGKNIIVRQNGNDILGLGKYDFGRLAPDKSKIISFTIENPGTEPLVLTGEPCVTILGDEAQVYTVAQQPSSQVIQPGGSVTFSIQFSGSTGSLHKGVINIPSNDPYAGEYLIRLYGYGYEAWNSNTNIWYPTIQDAVNDASSGQIIIVPDGEYFLDSQITITKGVTLRSQHGAQKTIINAMNYQNPQPHRCFLIDHVNAKLSGFTIKNGQSLIGGATFAGGGVYLKGGTVESCVFRNNVADGGGAMYVWSGRVDSCIFSNNVAGTGGAIVVYQDSTITRCVIEDNIAYDYGGGIYVFSAGQTGVLIQNCLIRNNIVREKGGGIYVGTSTGTVIVDLSTVVENKAVRNKPNEATHGMCGGIGWKTNTSSPIVTNSIVCFNTALRRPETNNYGNTSPSSSPLTSFSYTCTSPLPQIGLGNIDANPVFLSQGLFPFSLRKDSPCINAGNPNDIILPLPTRDLAGNLRLVGKVVDMGAYEFQTKITPGGTGTGNTQGQE